MSNKIEWEPGMTVAMLGGWRNPTPKILTVERVTPSGRAVLSNGDTVMPDGVEFGGGGGYARNRYAIATEEHFEMVAHAQTAAKVRILLDGWADRFRGRGKGPDHDTCKALLAALESVGGAE